MKTLATEYGGRLRVVADDFGIGVETSRGIVDAHLCGIVGATSVMTTTGDHLERSLGFLERAPELQLGIHLTLTSAAAVPLVATRASGCVGLTGTFRELDAMLVRSFSGTISRAAVEEELCAQVARFERVLGRKPVHVDGHHHAHQLPVVRDVVAEMIARGTLPSRVRSTVEPAWTGPAGKMTLRRRIVRALGAGARDRLSAAGGKVTDGFFGVLSATMLTAENPWTTYLTALPSEGTYEMMVHPGYLDVSLEKRDTYFRERVTELEAIRAWGRRYI